MVQPQAGHLGGGKFTSGFMAQAGELPVIATPKDLGTFPWNVVQTTRRYADGHGDTLTAYLKALSRAINFMADANNREKVIEAVLARATPWSGLRRSDLRRRAGRVQDLRLRLRHAGSPTRPRANP